jgi:hypothetical protein
MMRKISVGIYLILFFSGVLFLGTARADEEVLKLAGEERAGEFFGMPVSMGNYRFVKAAAVIFGSRWGGEPQTPEELENRAWEDLLLSFEAFRRNIVVSQAELDDEISKILKAEKVTFDFKKDRPAFEKWVQERVKEPAEIFENQLKHLIQLQKLRQQVIDSFAPAVSEEEAFQEYLDEYNTLGVELVQFDDLKKAEDFYAKMKNPRLWEKETKLDPKFAVRPGFVSLECLMDLWKIPREDCEAMLNLKEGSVYKQTPIYRGYAVFHTLQKRVAEKEKFPGLSKSYYDQVRMKKKYESFNEWLKAFKKDANIKAFTGPASKEKK